MIIATARLIKDLHELFVWGVLSQEEAQAKITAYMEGAGYQQRHIDYVIELYFID